MQFAVSELGEENVGKIIVENVDATTPEASQIVQDLGFTNHGIVIRSGDGELLFSQPDHQVVMDEVRAKLDELLAGGT